MKGELTLLGPDEVAVHAPQPATPALDYERVKDFFYEKLAADRHGRMESAFFHTAQWIFQQGIAGQAELLARIATLEAQLEAHASVDHDKRDRFIRSFLDPEAFGWTVSQEVRNAAREVLK